MRPPRGRSLTANRVLIVVALPKEAPQTRSLLDGRQETVRRRWTLCGPGQPATTAPCADGHSTGLSLLSETESNIRRLMSQLPFSIYDFFGYLASGFVVLVGLAAAFVGSDAWQESPETIVTLLLIVAA